MPIKTGRVRRNYDSALQSKTVCSNMLFMALAYLNNQLNYNASLSNAAIAKYENQRSIIAKCALSNGITKAQIREKTISISDTRYPSDKQVQQLADIVNGEDYSFNVSFIPDSDLVYKSEEELKAIKGQAIIQRKDIAIQEEKDFINLCEYIENEIANKFLHCNLSEDMKMRLRKIRNVEYDYKVILLTFKFNLQEIKQSVKSNLTDADISKRFNYIIGIIKNKLPDTVYYLKRRKEMEERALNDDMSVATHKGAEYQRKTRKAPRGTDDLW